MPFWRFSMRVPLRRRLRLLVPGIMLGLALVGTANAFLDEETPAPAKPAVKPHVVRQASATAQAATAGKVFKDCVDCPEMVVIPAGSFQMGSPSYEGGRSDDEGPVHEVGVSAFALGRAHVTRAQFAAFVRQTGYQTGNGCRIYDGKEWVDNKRANWRDPGFAQDDDHPVVCVNWNDASAYAQWLGDRTGKNYRLPSEAQWEYTARAGTRTARWWGTKDAACMKANSNRCIVWATSVDQHVANAWGLKDMLGNTWQWVQDCYHDNYQGAPSDGSAWESSCSGETRRVLRGGSRYINPPFVRSAFRLDFTPDNRYYSGGFRLARTLTP
jgi:formylglycine-generating enzyme required for sulfatase activity